MQPTEMLKIACNTTVVDLSEMPRSLPELSWGLSEGSRPQNLPCGMISENCFRPPPYSRNNFKQTSAIYWKPNLTTKRQRSDPPPEVTFK